MHDGIRWEEGMRREEITKEGWEIEERKEKEG